MEVNGLTFHNQNFYGIISSQELHADRLLIDERKGRQLAIQEGIAVIGLLGVVLLAKRRQLVSSARALLQRLEREAGMYLSADIREAVLRSVEDILNVGYIILRTTSQQGHNNP